MRLMCEIGWKVYAIVGKYLDFLCLGSITVVFKLVVFQLADVSVFLYGGQYV